MTTLKQPERAPIRCVIFDCDGTLVDSELLSQQALVDVFKQFGGTLSLSQCLTEFQGGKLTDILAKARQVTGVTASIDTIEPIYRERCRQSFERHLKPIEDVEETLEQLQSQGIALCVASNGPVDKIVRNLALTQLSHYFDDRIFSAFEIQCWKPEPDLLHYAAMQMGYRIEECVYVDDTIPGITAAINAQMQSIYFRSMPESATIQHPLSTTIHSMRQLIPTINHSLLSKLDA